MRAEIQTINLIQTSAYLRQLISALLGSPLKPWETDYANDLLLRLPLKETLRTLTAGLGCDEDAVFEKIAARVGAPAINNLSFNLTLEHLRELDSVEVQSQLSAIFNCDPWDVFDELLDIQAVLGTLFEIAPEAVRKMLAPGVQDALPFSQAGEAVRNILLAHRQIEEHFGIDADTWDRIVDEHGWLTGNAVDKLRGFCAERGIVQPTGASLLAAALQEYALEESADEVRLDFLAVVHLQQRVNWIVRQLHEQAEGLAQKVSASAEASSPWSRLEQHLKFYELKAPASAWRMALEPRKVNSDATTVRPQASAAGDRPLDSFRDALLTACANFLREVIQGLILAGVKLPSGLGPELDKRLSYELSIQPVKYHQDLTHIVNRDDVLNAALKDYAGQSDVRLIK